MTNVMMSESRRPETEVTEKATRRRYTAEYKTRILREAAQCAERGELGALLRREGLYSSHLNAWRAQAEQGQRAALTPKKRGPQAKAADPRDKKIVEQEREIAALRRRAERAEGWWKCKKTLRTAGDRVGGAVRGEELMNAVLDVVPTLGVSATCDAFGVPRATYYRRRSPMLGPQPARPSPLVV